MPRRSPLWGSCVPSAARSTELQRATDSGLKNRCPRPGLLNHSPKHPTRSATDSGIGIGVPVPAFSHIARHHQHLPDAAPKPHPDPLSPNNRSPLDPSVTLRAFSCRWFTQFGRAVWDATRPSRDTRSSGENPNADTDSEAGIGGTSRRPSRRAMASTSAVAACGSTRD